MQESLFLKKTANTFELNMEQCRRRLQRMRRVKLTLNYRMQGRFRLGWVEVVKEEIKVEFALTKEVEVNNLDNIKS